MIGSDISAIKDMLSSTFTRAAKEKDKAAPEKGSEKAGALLSQKETSNPAFLLSASLEQLTGHLRGMSEGASDMAKDAVARSDEALGAMKEAEDFTDEFAAQLESALGAMAEDFDRTLKAFGMGDEERAEALDGFRTAFGKDAQAGAIAAYREEERESTSVAVEVRNIELTIQQGDKTLSISFDSASLSLSSMRERSAMAVGPGGAAMESERSATRIDAMSRGLTVQADGFSEEELEGLMGTLNKVMSSKDPAAAFEGLATLKPGDKPKEGGPLALSLDLMGALKGAFDDGDGAKAAAAKPAEAKTGVDIVA